MKIKHFANNSHIYLTMLILSKYPSEGANSEVVKKTLLSIYHSAEKEILEEEEEKNVKYIKTSEAITRVYIRRNIKRLEEFFDK